MSATDFFFIMSAIYISPHTDKKTGTILGVASCVIAIISKFVDA